MSDVEEVKAARDGDREAFGRLVERYHRLVYGVCYGVTGNAADAEDLAQESFVEAFLKLHALRDPERFAGWLRTLALNVCRMWYRRARLRMVELDEEILPPAPGPEEAGSPYAEVCAGLSRLSSEHRLVLVLHTLEGLSYEEMARFLQVPVGTVMSRLYRARRALKKWVDEMPEQEEVPVVSDQELRREVDAEIAVLLRMYGDAPAAGERLSVVLRRSPERFRALVEQADDETIQANLALLLPRLGAPAVDAALEAYAARGYAPLAGEAPVEPPMPRNGGPAIVSPSPSPASGSEHALAILRRSIELSRPHTSNVSDANRGMASRYAYLLLDRLLQSRLRPAERAALLVELVDASEEDATTALLTSALLCDADGAFPLLAGRFWRYESTAEMHRHSNLLFALCRTGTRFVAELLPSLAAADERRRHLAVAGAEAVARSLDHHWLAEATPVQWADAVRMAVKWPPLRSGDLGQEALGALEERVAALLADSQDEIRAAALRTLAHLRAPGRGDAIAACLSHPALSTRLAAIYALSELRGPEAAKALLPAPEAKESAERRAALEALGRLRVPGALRVILGHLEDSDLGVRRAAVTALGEIDSDEARAVLQTLLRSPDRQTARAAAGALHGGVRRVTNVGQSPGMRERLLGLTEPARTVAHISLGAALRWAIPEDRSYEERELTRNIAQVCSDHSAVRRYLVDEGLMARAGGIYELTDAGRVLWRVEQCIRERYLGV